MLALGLIACGGGATSAEGGATEPTGTETHADTTGSEATATDAGPAATEASASDAGVASAAAPSDVELGAALFERLCTGCHPGGHRGEGPDLTRHARTSERMVRKIRRGADGMPAFGTDRISDEEMPRLLAYLASIGAVVDPAP
jgi:mono/diheme cytochrome c family protein